jgi:hypothetical protein
MCGGGEPSSGEAICQGVWVVGQDRQAGCPVLAVFGQRVQPKRYEGKSEAEKQLSALLVRRKQLEEMLKAIRIFLKRAHSWNMMKSKSPGD